MEDIKLLLGIQDNLQDSLLTLVIDDSQQRILTTLNQFAKKEWHGSDSRHSS